ncbi:MAG: hypothetical protein AAFX79_00365 [Planctomycetota bacterium]
MSPLLRWMGRIAMALGVLIMAAGLLMALLTYAEMIQGALADPLAESAAGDAEPERAAADRMLQWAIVGGSGLPLSIVGFIIARIARKNARRRKMIG